MLHFRFAFSKLQFAPKAKSSFDNAKILFKQSIWRANTVHMFSLPETSENVKIVFNFNF